jgi:hypothetical protein
MTTSPAYRDALMTVALSASKTLRTPIAFALRLSCLFIAAPPAVAWFSFIAGHRIDAPHPRCRPSRQRRYCLTTAFTAPDDDTSSSLARFSNGIFDR